MTPVNATKTRFVPSYFGPQSRWRSLGTNERSQALPSQSRTCGGANG